MVERDKVFVVTIVVGRKGEEAGATGHEKLVAID